MKKRILKILCIIIIAAFVVLPIKANAASAKWSQEIDLSDSISSSIIKIEDGVVVMQYEGSASDNNTLIKFDFDGNKIWEIPNPYGYNIASVSDGFIIWNGDTITKFDKDKDVIWSTKLETDGNTPGLKLIEVSDGYIFSGNSTYTYKLDKNGNFITSKPTGDMALNGVSGGYKIIDVAKNSDNDSFMILIIRHYISDYSLILTTIDKDLNVVKQLQNNLSWENYDTIGYSIAKLLVTDDGYLLSGHKMILLDENGKIKEVYNKISLDVTEINDYYYVYEMLEDSDNETLNYYDTAIIKYDKELKKQNNTVLPLSFYSEKLSGTGMPTGFSNIKNRVVYYEHDSKVDSIILNVPLLSSYGGDSAFDVLDDSYSMAENTAYGIARYRVSETEETSDTTDGISGIINNIIKNPQTNSIIIFVVIIVIVLIVSVISYVTYKNKSNITKKHNNK